MLPFVAANPYPLLTTQTHTYAEEQVHAAEVDRWLGLRTEEIERELVCNTAPEERKALWIGLPVRSLLTPYTEIRNILQHLQPRPAETVVDLGAGYGRIGFVMGKHFPESRFLGYEFVESRVAEANRCLKLRNIQNATVLQADLKAKLFAPQQAEYYFLYDYSTPASIQKTLNDLGSIAKLRKITVVGRGRSGRDLIEQQHPWLSQVVRPQHGPHYSIYRSRE